MVNDPNFKKKKLFQDFIGNNDDDDENNEISKKIKFEKINPDVPESYEKYTFSLKKNEFEGSYKTKLRLIVVI